MDRLLIGKVSLDYEKEITYLQRLGLALEGPYQSQSFRERKNTNRTLDFILNNLK